MRQEERCIHTSGRVDWFIGCFSVSPLMLASYQPETVQGRLSGRGSSHCGHDLELACFRFRAWPSCLRSEAGRGPIGVGGLNGFTTPAV